MNAIFQIGQASSTQAKNDSRSSTSSLKKNWTTMAILNPDHLFEQAEKLIAPQPAGRPRQVDVRRAISRAYYGLFHFMLTEVADEFIGVTQRTSDRYALVYRSINHNILKELCNAVKKRTPPAKYAPYFPAAGFDQNIQASAAAAVD